MITMFFFLSIILGKYCKKKPNNYLWSMHYSDSLENIDVILTIGNIYRQSLHHYTSSS